MRSVRRLALPAVALPLLAGVVGVLAFGWPASAQQGAPSTRPAPAIDPVQDAAQKVFDALPETERKSIQDDLIWGSDFIATVSGSFGKRTFDAITRFQKAAGLRPDGILDEIGRKRLAESAGKARLAARFAVLTDAKTGAALGVPQAALPKREVTATGTRWMSTDKTIVLETAVAAGGAAELPAAFERVLSVQAPGRKVTYKLLRPDFFVVAGEHGRSSFYTRYGIGPTSLRGYTLVYPTGQAKQLERIVIAVANTFQPMPGQTSSVATGPAQQPPGGGSPGTPPQAESWPPGLFRTGLVIGPGRLATAAPLDACTEITVNRRPARVLSTDRETGLAILEADIGSARAAMLVTASAPANGVEPVVVGLLQSGSGTTVAVTSGSLVAASDTQSRLIAPLAREAAGSVILDRSGALIGIVAAPDGKPKLVAGLVPAASHRIVPATAVIRAAGGASAAATGTRQTAGTLAAGLRGSLVGIECARPIPR